jgi:hypothetical protein
MNIDFVLDGLNLRHYFAAIVRPMMWRTANPIPKRF